jgi:hypothetical protein
MLQVGNAGDEGIVELQDLLFTTKGPTAGLILMEWNVAETSTAVAAMWDVSYVELTLPPSRFTLDLAATLTCPSHYPPVLLT